MSMLTRALHRELVDFIGKLQQESMDIAQVSKAAFCKARKKLKLKKDWWKVVERFYNSELDSQIVTLELPKKDHKVAGELGIQERKITCRLVKVALDSGETEILLTSLTDEATYSIADLKELYGLRWGIETHYCALKQKAELENFSGKSIKAIQQDYYAKIFILTYTAVLVQPVNRLLEQAPKKTHTHKVNFIEALARMKNAVIDLFIFKRIPQTLRKLYDWFAAFTEPIRKNRKFKRPKLPKTKRHRTYLSA
jgi:hypothetical protein